MTNSYCLVADVLDATPDVEWGTTYELILDALITRASRAIDGYLKRKPGAFYVTADETRYYQGTGRVEQWIDELAAAPTSVAVAESGVLTSYTAWSATDYLLWPYNAIVDGRPYIRLDVDVVNGTKSCWYKYPKSVKVIGKFGFSTVVPDEVAQATIIQCVRWFKRGQQAFQDTGATVDLGFFRFARRLDQDVEAILSEAKFQRVTV